MRKKDKQVLPQVEEAIALMAATVKANERRTLAFYQEIQRWLSGKYSAMFSGKEPGASFVPFPYTRDN